VYHPTQPSLSPMCYYTKEIERRHPLFQWMPPLWREQRTIKMSYQRDNMSRKNGFKNYFVLDKNQFNLLKWNIIKTLSNNAEQLSYSSLSGHNDKK
jgi:hypothetical protein